MCVLMRHVKCHNKDFRTCKFDEFLGNDALLPLPYSCKPHGDIE